MKGFIRSCLIWILLLLGFWAYSERENPEWMIAVLPESVANTVANQGYVLAQEECQQQLALYAQQIQTQVTSQATTGIDTTIQQVPTELLSKFDNLEAMLNQINEKIGTVNQNTQPVATPEPQITPAQKQIMELEQQLNNLKAEEQLRQMQQ